MIISWMVGATLFALLLAFAADALERATRALGRQARWPWAAALGAAVAWPVVAFTLLRAAPRGTSLAPVVITTTATRTIAAQLPSLWERWAPMLGSTLLWAWGAVTLALLARLATGMLALRRMERTGAAAAVDGIPVLLTDAVGPAVFGTLRPRVVVPRWLLELDAPLRKLVLGHEEEHRRAGDAVLVFAGAVATALVPWNAAVWFIARRLRLAVELDCDQRVLGAHGDAQRYGKLLLLIAQRQQRARLAPMLAESNSHLERRISTMNAQRTRRAFARVVVFGSLAAGAVALACSNRVMGDITSPTPTTARKAAGVRDGAPVFFEFQVQNAAQEAPNTQRPRYPDILRSAGVEGEVIAQYVVDENGLPLAGSLRILRSTHELFSTAVATAFPGMRFIPAEVEGKKVRQLVQQPFYFNVQGSTQGGATEVRSSTKNGVTSTNVVTLPGKRGEARVEGGRATATTTESRNTVHTLNAVIITVPNLRNP